VASQSWIDKDFYAILGVPKTASPDEIKKAYRTLAKELHPDRNAGKDAEDRFKEIGEAYSVLSNSEKRGEYDKLRDAVAAGIPGVGRGGFHVSDFGFGEEFDVEDLLNQIFGGAGVRFGGFGGGGQGPFGGGQSPFGGQGPFGGGFGFQGTPMRGRDVETETTLTFQEAADGCQRKVRMNFGGGPSEVTVKIPAGVSDGARIRVRSRGEPGPQGAPAGDLFVRVRVQPHEVFARKGRDLTLNLPVTFYEAVLGAQVAVPTLNGGPVKLKIPAGTSSGQTFRLSGRGIKHADGNPGDILATVQVTVPKELSEEQKELVRKLAESEQSSQDDLEESDA
jgi:molecular chaperone DnaJ